MITVAVRALPRPFGTFDCGVWGCPRTPTENGYCHRHNRRFLELGMTVKPDTHVRSLRMRPAVARAVREAARRMELPENQFIVQAITYVCGQAGIQIDEPQSRTPDLAGPLEPWQQDLESAAEDPFR